MQSPAPTYETEIGIVGHLPTYSGVTVVEDVRGQHVMRASSGTSLTRMPTREIDHYTVVLRGETFTLYRDQIEFDAPNYFTALFLDGLREPTVSLSRSPELFRVIVDYMSGYTVLPLVPEMIPPTMTRETALANLLNDAEYYQLAGLVRLLRPAPSSESLLAPLETYRFRRLAPRAMLRFDEVLSKAKLDVVFDSAKGIVSSVDGECKPVLISMDGVRLMYTNTFTLMLTKVQQRKLESRGLFQRPLWVFRQNLIPGVHYVKPPYTWHDGTPYVTPNTEFSLDATIRLNGSEIPRHRLLAICAEIVRGRKNDGSFDAPVEKNAFETLETTWRAENRTITVWCRKLLFTICCDSADSLIFRIVHADCVTRDQISQLAV